MLNLTLLLFATFHMAQHWPPDDGHINANDEQSFQIQTNHSTAPPAGLQWQVAPRQENIVRPFLTDPDDFFGQSPVPDATRLWRAEGRNDMALGHKNPSSPDLTGFNFQGQFPLPSDGIESSQAGNCQVLWPWYILPNGDLLTSWPITYSSVSSPRSPIEPSAAGHLPSQDLNRLSDSNPQGVSQFPFSGDEHLEAGNRQVPWALLIPSDFPTSYPSPPQSSVGPSPSWHPSSQDLTDTTDYRGFFSFPLGRNERSQPGDALFIPLSGEAGLSTSYPIIDSSPQSPVGPSPSGHLSSQNLTDINSQGFFTFPLGRNEHSQAGNVLFNPFSGAVGSPTSYPIINSSPQSPLGPSPSGHPSSQDLTDTNSQDFFPFPLGRNEHSQPSNGLFNPPSGAAGSPTSSYPIIDSSPQSPVGPSPSRHLYSTDTSPQGLPQFGKNLPRRLIIPPSGAAGPPTSSTTTTASSAQSSVGSSAAGPHVTTNDEVGSPQIRKASARRRKKDGIYRCMFDNCNSTFTAPHNLQHHINVHLGLKPFKCTMCKFATVYPTSLPQHMMKRHKQVVVQAIP